MVPPIPFDQDVPISRWEQYQSFDSAEDCEGTNLYLHKQAEKFTREQRINPTTLEQAEAEQYMDGKCIEADDPRLKEK